MIKSMTGFGRSEHNDGQRNVTAEIRTVNHRFCDITVKMPRRYSFAEERIKAAIKETVKRGKVDLSLSVEAVAGDDVAVRINTAAARRYHDNLVELKQELGLEGEISVALLASLPDVMKTVGEIEDEEAALASLLAPVLEAVARLDEMRAREGAELARDIDMRGGLLREMAARIEERAPLVAAAYATKLRERISDLLAGAVEVPEDRILLEAAIFADKANVTEELVRLDSHISHLSDILSDSSQPDGKKLDFLVQEMNREVNTIGSKANDIEITNRVLAMKSEIEKIREQVQNIE